ncbi:MAG: hypothetical protein E7356_03760 [Clostridiales bacterium]|nr:hypothetical protein [Clostridiales bacterium]
MNIGIDIDGVLQDTEQWFEAYANIYDHEIGGNGIVNPDSYKFTGKYAWTEDQFMVFLDKYMYMCMENAQIMPGAKEILAKLQAEGHKLFVITARGINFEREETIALKFLDKLGVKFESVHFKSRDKVPPCVDNQIDYMIDDAPFNIENLSNNGVKCLYFRSSIAKDINHPNVTDVYNWGEVYRFFQNVNK